MINTIEGTPRQIAVKIAELFANLPANGVSADQQSRAVLILETILPTQSPIIPADDEFERLMSEADHEAVSFGAVDDSREAIYTRMPGE